MIFPKWVNGLIVGVLVTCSLVFFQRGWIAFGIFDLVLAALNLVIILVNDN